MPLAPASAFSLYSTLEAASAPSIGAVAANSGKMQDRLGGAYRRLERAQMNLKQFHTEYCQYFASSPCRLNAVIHTGGHGEIVSELLVPLPDWAMLVADTVTDLRFALDYLAYELVAANTGQDPPPDWRGISFPIYASKERFKDVGLRAIRNMAPRVQATIQRAQPYKVTAPKTQTLYLLNDLCDSYKHRLLAPVMLMLDKASLTWQPIHCTVKDVTIQPQWSNPIENKAVVATFTLDNVKPCKSRLVLGTQPFCRVVFPKGTAAENVRVGEFLISVTDTIRQAAHVLTRLQWGVPMDLPALTSFE